jgi:riboflavin kinase/FMN adenylyltransferase
MKIYNHIDEFRKIAHAAVTIGTFDGVHLGHQKIINRLKVLAKRAGAETVVLTFFPHPRMILNPEDASIRLISTMAEKAQQLDKLGIDHLIITPFTRDFSNLSPQEYIKNILVDQIGMKHIVIGYDHRFGKNREGGLQHLQQFAPIYGFEIEEISQQDIHDVAVSSTKIRHALLSGDVEIAHEFLGYSFHLTGKVVRGDQIGRKIGFPTANIFVEENYKLIPADGIYAVEVEILNDETQKLKTASSILKGMAYIGHRPTINGMTRNIEVHIFDFGQDIYDQLIRIHFIHFVREDQKFNSLEELRIQLGEDEKVVRGLLF